MSTVCIRWMDHICKLNNEDELFSFGIIQLNKNYVLFMIIVELSTCISLQFLERCILYFLSRI
jgi:hypothetical protein